MNRNKSGMAKLGGVQAERGRGVLKEGESTFGIAYERAFEIMRGIVVSDPSHSDLDRDEVVKRIWDEASRAGR